MQNSTEFIGQLLGSSILEYMIISFVFTILFTLLFNKYIWIFLWENILLITMTFILPAFMEFLINYISSKIVIGEIIYNRIFFQIVEAYQIICASLNGLSFTFYRLIIGLGGLFLGVLRFDESLLPEWTNKLIKLDPMVNAFKSFLQMNHYFNNPIKESFIELINKPKLLASRKKARNKLWKLFILTFYNPQINSLSKLHFKKI